MRKQDGNKDMDADKDWDIDGDVNGHRDQMPLPTVLVLLRRIKQQLLMHLRVNWAQRHGTQGQTGMGTQGTWTHRTWGTQDIDTEDAGHMGTHTGHGHTRGHAGRGEYTEDTKTHGGTQDMEDTQNCSCVPRDWSCLTTDRGCPCPQHHLSVLAMFIWEQSLNVLDFGGGIPILTRFRVKVSSVPSHSG